VSSLPENPSPEPSWDAFIPYSILASFSAGLAALLVYFTYVYEPDLDHMDFITRAFTMLGLLMAHVVGMACTFPLILLPRRRLEIFAIGVGLLVIHLFLFFRR
jgi:hypothetical protein